MSAHTPGPWCWTVNPKSFSVELSRGQYGDSVLRFMRWGMGGASPLFRRDGLMVRAVDLSVVEPGREHHAEWWRLIDHPDAHLIAAAPTMYEALLDLVHGLAGADEDFVAQVDRIARAAIAKAEGRS